MEIRGEHVYIRRSQVADVEEVLDLNLRNLEFFAPYRPISSEITLEYMRERLERLHREWEEDKTYSFHVYLIESNELIGTVDLMFVKRGPGQSAMIGYELDQAHNGKGLMSEAVLLCLKFGFEHANLHRIEAGAMPRNVGSNRLLEKVGFTYEGLHRKNVKINGAWEDHNQWAILDTDWQEKYGR